jgi:hypothetical protein
MNAMICGLGHLCLSLQPEIISAGALSPVLILMQAFRPPHQHIVLGDPITNKTASDAK